MTKIVSKILAVIMMINIISINHTSLSFADENEIPSVKLSTYRDGNIKESIDRGQKGVEYNIDSLHIEHDKSLRLDKNNFNISKLDEKIEIMINGDTKDHIDSGNSKLKFNFKYDEIKNTIKVEIKEGQSNNTHMKPFILRKHSLYNIKIPAGLFIDSNGKKSEEINYTFTTKGDGLYGKDIIKDISPSDKSTSIDYEKGEILVEFIDDIFLNADVNANKANYFEIRSSSITDPNVPNYENTVIEDINKFDIFFSEKTLRLKSKDGKLDDFATYNLTIKSGAIQLKNSRGLTIITNSTQNIMFTTDNWIDSINLNTDTGVNNEWIDYKLPLGNIEDVPINPLIQIKFKYPVELKDKTKIKFSSDAHDFSIDVGRDSWINYDGNTLKLDINSLYRSGENPLRKDTAYKITIDKGALNLKGYSNSQTNGQIENEEMNIYFITGKWTTNTDPGLYVTGYSSDDLMTDNIVNKEDTNLDKNGQVFIHFNRKIQWNKWDTSINTNAKALPYFKLYKIPSAYQRDYSEKGVVFDKQFRYDGNQNIYTKNGIIEDQIPIESVELYGDKIKIKPKYELINWNEYRVVLTNKNIVTDFHEKTLRNNINQRIWTKKSGIEGKPEWTPPEDIKAEEIKENTNSPYKEYRLFGVPEYNEHIDKENGKPIVVYVDKEVIPNPEEINPLGGVILSEGYSYSNHQPIMKGIKWYKIEHLGQGHDKRTKISFYPKETLDAGKFYRFKIPNNTFVTRNGEGFDRGVEFKFVIEGDKTDNKGIYRVNITNANPPFLTNHFPSSSNPFKLDIKGYNFNEDIRGIRFVRQRDGHTIRLGSEHVKFKNVTELEAEIRGSAATQFSKEGNGGVYKIYIDFGDGVSASGGSSQEASFIIKERPRVIRTDPRKTSEGTYIDKNLVYSKTDGDGNLTYYISITFRDIDGKLKLVGSLNDYTDISVNITNGSNIVDESKNMIIESGSNDEFTVRIPLEEELQDNQRYEVTIPEGLVDFDDISTGGNKGYEWQFSTRFSPGISTDRPFKGSVVEEYDVDYPLIIHGRDFLDSTKIYFKDGSGDRHEAYKVELKVDEQGKQRLEVFLPRGRDKLKVGAYDIIISNGPNYEAEYTYDVLSVVPKGDYVPNEDFEQTDNDSNGGVIVEGTLKKYIKTSNDTLELDKKYINNSELSLNLDEIMGQDVWSRNIGYEASRGTSINKLTMESRWTNISLSDVKLDSNSTSNKILIRTGRTSPTVRDNVKKRIKGSSIKSEFIEVGGNNYRAGKLNLSIPFTQSNGRNLKLLKYDEDTRRITEIRLTGQNINTSDKRINVELTNALPSDNVTKGIFVIVE